MSGSGYLMTLEEKRDCIEAICAQFEHGSRPVDIARRFNLSSSYVRSVLNRHGYDTSDVDPAVGHGVHPMWDDFEEGRREAIIRMAAEGARTRLQELRRQEWDEEFPQQQLISTP